MTSMAKVEPSELAITSTPDIMGGEPCISGTRVPAEMVLVHINGGYSEADFLRHYDWLPSGVYDLVIEWALANGLDVKLPHRRVSDA